MPLIFRRFYQVVAATIGLLLALAAQASDKATIVADSQQALESLGGHVSGAGVLVFPDVVKVGFGGADEYGDGCLLVKGKPVAFYSTSGAAYGLPLGVRSKSEVVLFMTVGVNGDITLVRMAAGGGIDAATTGEPILGFIFSDKGLARGLTLDGASFTRLAR
jgi:lipid-binding SYLF domain-containing protein